MIWHKLPISRPFRVWIVRRNPIGYWMQTRVILIITSLHSETRHIYAMPLDYFAQCLFR